MANKEIMTPKARVLSAVYGGWVDRTPVGSCTAVTTHEQMAKVGVGFPEAHIQAEPMARLAAASYEILGWDTIKVPFSVWNLAGALGAPMDWGNNNKWPDGKHPIYSTPEEVQIPDDLLEKESTSAVLGAIKILKGKYPDVCIVGTVMGPLTQSFDLIGVEKVMKMIATDPEKVKEFLNIFKEPVIKYANAQVEAGIDILDFADHATGGLVSASVYRDIVMPVHKEIVSRIKCPVVLHICGNCLDRLEYIIEAGFPCFNIDTACDPYKAKSIVGDRLRLWGGVSNINSLFQGTPEDVKKECFNSLEAGYEIIGAECTVPLQVKDENLIAVLEAAREFALPQTEEEKINSFAKGLARNFIKEDTDRLRDFVADLSKAMEVLK